MDALSAAREAVDRHAWSEARQAYADAADAEPLGADDLVRLAQASWWAGYPDDSFESFERAYAAYIREKKRAAAAYIATQLAYLAFRRASFSVGGGWIAKAEELLVEEPDAPEHAWLRLTQAAGAAFGEGDVDTAMNLVDEAIDLGRQRSVPEVRAMGTSLKGFTMIGGGAWRDGMALIDEAAASAVADEIDLQTACLVYCNTIAACRNIADYGRASEWTERADRWMERNSLGGYPGICRVHRAELSKLHGLYGEAEQQARVACEELERYRITDGVATAHKEMGDIRLRRGDFDAAAESFAKAYELGTDAQPGRALLLLAQGDLEGAKSSIESALARSEGAIGEGAIRLSRSRLLPAAVKIALADDDAARAGDVVDELEAIAAELEGKAFAAAAQTARGQVELHHGRHAEAQAALDGAWRLWRDIDLPYESAEARAFLGDAKAAAGDEATARMEWEAARSAFERLGAIYDANRVAALLGDEVTAIPGGEQRLTKTFMFTDIVTSTDLVDLIGDAAWEDLMRWHDRVLRAELDGHHGQEVRHTGDGFFIAFDRASDAVDAAVAIQRRLDRHRHQHGFAPWVRIGIHTAEATKHGTDYSGKGVHVAARVGNIGDKEEVVISADAVVAAGSIRYPISAARPESLKGIPKPVQVHTIEWR